MTVLNPNNKPASLRVDEDGRLRVTGTGGGGGGGGLDEEAVQALIDTSIQTEHDGFVVPQLATKQNILGQLSFPGSGVIQAWQKGYVLECGSNIDVTVPAGLPGGIYYLLVQPGSWLTVSPDTGVSLNGLEQSIRFTDPSARLIAIIPNVDQDPSIYTVEVLAGVGMPARGTYATPTNLTDNDSGTIIEAASVTVDAGNAPGFSCVVIVPEGGTLTVTGGSVDINGVADGVVTRAWADGNRLVAIVQRHSDTDSYVVSGV